MDLTLSERRKSSRSKSRPNEGERLPKDANEKTLEAPLNFDDLFAQHWQRLCRALTGLVGDPDEAEDLALEAFVRLHQQPPPRRDNLGGWLYRVGTNLGLNALRARKRRRSYEEQAGALALEGNAIPDPAAALERRQERGQVRQTLSAMKPRAAQILILRYSGLSYAEMAAALGVKPSSVGTLLARAEREFEKMYGTGDRG